jgi:hypothetical protein
VLLATLDLVERVGDGAERRRVRARLVAEVERIEEAVRRSDWQDHDAEVFADRADEVRRNLARPS